MTNRHQNVTAKVKTPFGSMYIHIDFEEDGTLKSAWIHDPQKEPDSQVAQLVESLSEGMNSAVKGVKVIFK